MVSKSRTNIRLSTAVEKYLQRITNEGQVPTSIRTASYALARLQKAVGTRREPDPWVHLITVAQMDDYCYGPDGIRQGIQADSFNRYRSVLIKFFEYALTMQWTDTSPMGGISRSRPDMPKSRLLLSATEMEAMLELTTNPVERISLSLGMNTGLRGNDIRHLTVFDASLSSGTIQTEIRKTRKLDVKPITMDLHRELVRWLDEYARLVGLGSRSELPNDYLLVPAYNLPAPRAVNQDITIRPRSVHTCPWRMVQRPLAKMGYPTKGEGFHTLRRSSARALFELLRAGNEGRDHALMIVKDFLNHTHTSTTEHYLGLSHERALRDTLLKDRPFLSQLANLERQRVSEEVRQLGA